MSTEIPDLWPDTVSVSRVLTPVAILRHQANKLRERTKGVLEAEIHTKSGDEEGEVEHEFAVIAPGLDRYRIHLLSVSHDENLVYPSTVHHGDPLQEGFWDVEACSDEEELLRAIGVVLGSPSVRSLLLSLIARSTDTTDSLT